MPKARKSDLITRKIPGEQVVYDLKRHKALCLNDTAAKIWRLCNGQRTVADLIAELENDLQTPVDSRIVGLALNQLETSHLLERSSGVSSSAPLSRRALIRAGLATAIALPIVTMIASPTAYAQASAITPQACAALTPPCPGGPCTTGSKDCVFSPKGFVCKCK